MITQPHLYQTSFWHNCDKHNNNINWITYMEWTIKLRDHRNFWRSFRINVFLIFDSLFLRKSYEHVGFLCFNPRDGNIIVMGLKAYIIRRYEMFIKSLMRFEILTFRPLIIIILYIISFNNSELICDQQDPIHRIWS